MSQDLPSGYRWADETEMDRKDAIVVPRTVDSQGHPYTHNEADVAVPAESPAADTDSREVVTGQRFVCETHDAPGSREEECARLIADMSMFDGVEFDPTGCSYGPPRPRIEYRYDTETKAVIEVTLTPVELLDA